MIKVKAQEDIFIEKTSTHYEKGQEVEVSDTLAKRHIGTGIFKEVAASKPKVTKPKSATKPKQDLPEPAPEPIQEPEAK